MQRSMTVHAALCGMLMLLTVPRLEGQRPLGDAGGFGPRRRETPPAIPGGDNGEFIFVRAVYSSPNQPYWYRQYGGAWAVDFPEADEHFIVGLRDWVGVGLNVSSRHEQVRITDERLFDYPFVYIVEPGFMELSDEEAARLREYILRGGFLFLDDFHGEGEWQNVQRQMKKVLPEYVIVDLPLKHPVFHTYFDIDEVVQVPGVAALVYNRTYEKGGVTPHYMGIEDKNGRLVVFITRNSDLGDAWEWINDSRYPVKYGLVAYKIGINAVIYAMAH